MLNSTIFISIQLFVVKINFEKLPLSINTYILIKYLSICTLGYEWELGVLIFKRLSSSQFKWVIYVIYTSKIHRYNFLINEKIITIDACMQKITVLGQKMRLWTPASLSSCKYSYKWWSAWFVVKWLVKIQFRLQKWIPLHRLHRIIHLNGINDFVKRG